MAKNILSNLAAQVPETNQRVAQGMREARLAQLSQNVAAISQAAPTPQAAAPQIAQAAQQATQQGVQAGLQQQQQAQQQVAGLQEQQTRQQAGAAQLEAAERELALDERQMFLAGELSRIQEDAADKLLNAQLTFKRDEQDRALFNERQLLDYAVVNAKNENEFRQYEQTMLQALERKNLILETVSAKIKQQLQQEYEKGNQELNQARIQELAQMKRDLDKKLADEEARARNTAMILQGVGMAGGAVAGTFIPVGGTIIGAKLGAQLGGAAATGLSGAINL